MMAAGGKKWMGSHAVLEEEFVRLPDVRAKEKKRNKSDIKMFHRSRGEIKVLLRHGRRLERTLK
jgi:hypothetical protein